MLPLRSVAQLGGVHVGPIPKDLEEGGHFGSDRDAAHHFTIGTGYDESPSSASRQNQHSMRIPAWEDAAESTQCCRESEPGPPI